MDASFNELGKKIFDNPNISEAEKNDFMRELAKLKIQKINLLITGDQTRTKKELNLK